LLNEEDDIWDLAAVEIGIQAFEKSTASPCVDDVGSHTYLHWAVHGRFVPQENSLPGPFFDLPYNLRASKKTWMRCAVSKTTA